MGIAARSRAKVHGEWDGGGISLCVCVSLFWALYISRHYCMRLFHFYLSEDWRFAILCAHISPWQPSNGIFCLPVNMTFQHNLTTIKITLLVSLFQIPWQETRTGWDCFSYLLQPKWLWPLGQSLLLNSCCFWVVWTCFSKKKCGQK